MITETVISVFFDFFKWVVSLLPKIEGVLPTDFNSLFLDVVTSAYYFLPMNIVASIISLSIMLDITHITWKTAMRIKSFIPTLGG